MRKAPVLPMLAAAAMLLLGAWSAEGQTRPAVALVDSLGRTVTVPGQVDRIISLEPEITRILVALGAGEKLVGIDYFLRHHDHLFPLVFPRGSKLPVVSNQAQELSVEEAVRLRPDVIFSSPSEFRMAESIERKLDAPVLALASKGRFAGLLDEIRTLGRIVGREERAAALVAYFEETLRSTGRIAPPASLETRPSVYLAFWGSLVRTPVSYDPVEAAGGRNAAAGLLPDYLGAAGASITLETLLVWDPDVILVQGNYLPAERRVSVESVLRDPRLTSLRAVKSRRVHYTFGYWYWWDPALVLVETVYLARLLTSGGPPRFDLTAEGDAVFKEFYGIEGAFSALCRILACHEWTAR
jgi:iron complex transport system substrate-binding protein